MGKVSEGFHVVIYARVSQDSTGRGLSVSDQVKECQAWADREGWTVAEVIRETGSASRYARTARPEWARVSALLATGTVDALLTWEASRATRRLEEFVDLRALCIAHGIQWGSSGRLDDLSRDTIMPALRVLLAEDEAARTSDRVRRAVRARVEQGRPHGRIPYGYRRQRSPGGTVEQVPDEDTAPTVRRIYAEVVAGGSIHAVMVGLNADGIAPPRRPNRDRPDGQAWWNETTIRRMVASPTYAGLRVHQGQVVGAAAWAPLVDRATWDAAQAAIAHPPRPARPVRWLLSGIARCSECGGPLRCELTRAERRIYACRSAGCYRVARSQPVLDEHVVTHLLALLAAADVRAVDGHEDELASARADLDALRTRLDGFADAAADGSLSPAGLARVEARVLPQIEAAQARVTALSAPPPLSDVDLSRPSRAWWDDELSIKDQRRILDAYLSVVVHPAGRGARRFDPERVKLTPKW